MPTRSSSLKKLSERVYSRVKRAERAKKTEWPIEIKVLRIKFPGQNARFPVYIQSHKIASEE